MMRTVLTSWTSAAERKIIETYLLCRNKFSELPLDDKTPEERIDRMWRDHHFGCFEEASATIIVTGISRSCSHQLVRHRLFSFKQLSMRAVPVPKLRRIVPPSFSVVIKSTPIPELDRAIPPSIHHQTAALRIERNVHTVTRQAYDDLLALGIPIEDARYVATIGTETQVAVTGNLRVWLHFLNMRTPKSRNPNEAYIPGKGPQWEIRALAWNCYELLKQVAPLIFDEKYKVHWKYV